MRTLARWLALVALALALPIGAAAPSFADEVRTRLTHSTTLDASKVATSTGTLTGKKHPIVGAEIVIELDGYPATTAITDANGNFRATFSMRGIASGAHTVTARFVGDDRFESAESSTKVTVPDPPQAKLTLSIDTATAASGQLLTLTGKLTDGSGKAITNAVISFTANNQRVADSTTATVADGSYATYLVVPDSQSAQMRITASYQGNDLYAGVSAHANLQLILDEPESATPETQTPAPTPTPTATVVAAPTAAATTAAPIKVERSGESGPGVPWVLLGLVAAAIFGASVTFGLVYRDRLGQSKEAADSLLDDLDDADA